MIELKHLHLISFFWWSIFFSSTYYVTKAYFCFWSSSLPSNGENAVASTSAPWRLLFLFFLALVSKKTFDGVSRIRALLLHFCFNLLCNKSMMFLCSSLLPSNMQLVVHVYPEDYCFYASLIICFLALVSEKSSDGVWDYVHYYYIFALVVWSMWCWYPLVLEIPVFW